MLDLNMPTTMMAYVVIVAIGLIVMLQLWHQNRAKYEGLNLWVATWAFHLSGSLLIGLRNILPDWMSILVGNSLILGGLVYLFFGLSRFTQVKNNRVEKYAIGVMFLMFLIIEYYYTYIQYDLQLRSANLVAATSLAVLLSMWLLLKRVRPEIRQISGGVIVSLAVLFTLSLFRLIGYLFYPDASNEFLQAGLYQTILLILVTGATALLTFNLALMVNRRIFRETQQMEEAVRQREKELQAAFSLTTVGFVVLADDRIKEINEAACKMLGFSREEIIENDSLPFFHSEEEAKIRKAISLEILAAGTSTLEMPLRRKDNSAVPVILSVSAFDRKNPSAGAVVSFIDITERKKAEEKLAESEKLYRSLFENMLNGFAYCRMINEPGRLPDFEYLAVNTAFERLTGLRNVSGRRVSEVIPGIQESDKRLFEIYGKVAAGGPPETFELYLNTLKMWFSVSVYCPAEGYFVAVFDVVTERKQAESYRQLTNNILTTLNKPAEVRDSMEQILRTIKQATGADAVGIRLRAGNDFPYLVQSGFTADFLLTENSLIERDKSGGICLDEAGNVSLECTCGLVISGKTDSANTLLTPGGSFWTNNAMPLLKLTPEEDPRLHPRNRCIHHGFASVALIPIRSKNAIVGLLQLNGREKDLFTLSQIENLEVIAGLVGEGLTRRLAEEALTDSESRYRTLADSGRALIWTSGTDKLCDYFNQPWLDFTGRTLEQELGNGWTEGVHPDDMQRCLYVYTSSFDKRERFSMEYRLRDRHGEYRWLQDDGSPRYDARGSFLGYIGHCLDITERKQAEEVLKEEITIRVHFIDILAHELRAPLSPIIASTDILKQLTETGSDERLKKLAVNASNGARILSGRLDELLEMARYSRGSFTLNVGSTDIGQFIQDVAQRYKPSIEKSEHILDVTIAPQLPGIRIDSSKMEQVLINLLSNACKYSPAGSRVELGARIENNDLIVDVRDYGKGLSESDQEQLFKPYHRLQQDRKSSTGLGLGLSICQKIVEAHGGSIQVISRLGEGSTFRVRLPLSNQ
ncbi:MAG TPA: PAS domain S-box protein [Dehalococcoidales bacterium]|nr:PAS domain S-box protein [Dehalococcoidales bacterium]